MNINHLKLRIIFAGTPPLSADILQALLNNKNLNIIAILTQPDRKKGRGNKINISPVKRLSISNNIKIFQPILLQKDIEISYQIKKLKPDVIIVIAYGLILPKTILNIPKYGCINIHLSLLPKWRGAAPIQRAIEAGDQKTGVTIIQMDEGLDTGDILYQIQTNIDIADTAISLTKRLTSDSILAINKVLIEIANHGFLVQKKKQKGIVSYAKKITKKESHISWKLPAHVILQKVRAFNPWPGTSMSLNNIDVKFSSVSILKNKFKSCRIAGKIINISNQGMDIQSSTEIIRIKSLQFPGKKIVSIKSLLNGYNLNQFVGLILN